MNPQAFIETFTLPSTHRHISPTIVWRKTLKNVYRCLESNDLHLSKGPLSDEITTLVLLSNANFLATRERAPLTCLLSDDSKHTHAYHTQLRIQCLHHFKKLVLYSFSQFSIIQTYHLSSFLTLMTELTIAVTNYLHYT